MDLRWGGCDGVCACLCVQSDLNKTGIKRVLLIKKRKKKQINSITGGSMILDRFQLSTREAWTFPLICIRVWEKRKRKKKKERKTRGKKGEKGGRYLVIDKFAFHFVLRQWDKAGIIPVSCSLLRFWIFRTWEKNAFILKFHRWNNEKIKPLEFYRFIVFTSLWAS